MTFILILPIPSKKKHKLYNNKGIFPIFLIMSGIFSDQNESFAIIYSIIFNHFPILKFYRTYLIYLLFIWKSAQILWLSHCQHFLANFEIFQNKEKVFLHLGTLLNKKQKRKISVDLNNFSVFMKTTQLQYIIRDFNINCFDYNSKQIN